MATTSNDDNCSPTDVNNFWDDQEEVFYDDDNVKRI